MGVFDLQLQIIRRYYWFYAFFPYSCAVMISNGEILAFDRPAVLMGSIPVRIGTAFGGAIAYWTTASNMLAAIDFDLRSVDVG